MHALDRTRDAIFVERLHAKSLVQGLTWITTEHEGRYQVHVGEVLVEIGEGSGDPEHADPEILICRPDGRALEILTPSILPESRVEGVVPRRQAFVEIYEAARRMALGVDKVLEDLILKLM